MEMIDVELLRMQVEILKLKADDYNWQCHVPEDVKMMLENTLKEINNALGVNCE